MFTEINKREFANGIVYALRTDDGYLIEVTDTFLPKYTKNVGETKDNCLIDTDLGSRADRWMIGVSTMSGCPVGCLFCATGKLKKCRNLTAAEIAAQVDFVTSKHKEKFGDAFEHKINYTRMGEPFLNISNVRLAISLIESKHPSTHHYISTVGIKDSDFSWIEGNITLQVSVHSLIEEKRNNLIPFKNKMTLKEIGQIRTKSDLKTTVNMTLVDDEDFDIIQLKSLFDKEAFFIKLSPINPNEVSVSNGMGLGIIKTINKV